MNDQIVSKIKAIEELEACVREHINTAIRTTF